MTLIFIAYRLVGDKVYLTNHREPEIYPEG